MEFKELIEVRRSVRKYIPAEISREEVETIITEALNAPSWKNRAPTRYHVVLDAALKEKVRTEAMLGSNAEKSRNAAAIVAVTFRKSLSGFTQQPDGTVTPDNEFGEGWGAYDAGLATSYFLLAAKDHGWDSLVIGIRDAAKARQLLSLPDDEVMTSFVLLGKAEMPPVKVVRKAVDEVATFHL